MDPKEHCIAWQVDFMIDNFLNQRHLREVRGRLHCSLYQDNHIKVNPLELRLALISYQDHHMLLPCRRCTARRSSGSTACTPRP